MSTPFDGSFRYLLFGVCGIWIGLAAGCGSEIDSGSQLAGQRCFNNSHCKQGLVCNERRCVPVRGTRADAGGPSDTGTDVVDCEVGTRTCVGTDRVRICRSGGPVVRRCRGDVDMVCRGGRCVRDRPCQDDDGDGYGKYCGPGPDCNDQDPDINSGESERCTTPVDDNCDGNVNEGCTDCCPSGCGSQEYCRACECTTYDPMSCQKQMQPCQRGASRRNFGCQEVGRGQNRRRRCVKLCDKTQNNPASQCPTPNSACAAGTDRRGACLHGCTVDQGCGIEGFGCVPYYKGSREGICVPTNDDNAIGETCNSQREFDCEAGGICVALGVNGPGASCREACRPFGSPNGSDCAQGKKCLPIPGGFGVCVEDSGKSVGDSCNRRARICGEDAVACLAEANGRLTCQRVCRIAEGNTDCEDGAQCRRADALPEELGVCR